MYRWTRGEISSFKYLSLVNALVGRTYEHLHDRYPLFPSVKVDNFQTCPDKFFINLDGSFMTGDPESPPIPPELFVMPEYYFLAGGGRDPLTVYANRKALEAREDLHLWLARASDENCPDPLPFSGGHEPRAPFLPRRVPPSAIGLSKAPIVFCGPIKHEHEQRFAVVAAKGKWAIWKVVGKVEEEKVTIQANRVVSGTFRERADCQFAIVRDELVRCNGRILGVVRDGRGSVEGEVDLISSHISENCCQISETTLGVFQTESINVTVFAIVPARIACFARSEKFNITVIGCLDTKLRIRSNETGLKVATVSLDGQIATRLLITKGWGFIVALTDSHFFVLTVNGLLVQKIERTVSFNNWFTFRVPPGFDFIALSLDNGKLRYFEAADPINVHDIEVEGGAILSWTYLWRHDCFLAVCQDGFCRVVPRNSNEVK
jgi:hypothetical protein